MIYTDLPIQNVEEDELNRVEFTKNLGNLINNYKKEECLVLSLMGEWGSGKTSLINLTLNELSKNNIIIRFDPWLFPEHEKLILHFFNELSSNITFKDNSRQKCFRKNLKKLVNSLTLSASLTIPLPLIGLTLSATKHSDNTSSYESLEKLKEDINKDLDSLDSKIIIVIDNIDRLNKSEVKEIFQLVKSLADFKNIIYILSFDKKVVLESLDSYVSSPEIFLEKIIQIPIDVPKIEKYKLQEYFQNKLKKLLNTKEIFNNEEIRTISYLSVFIKNIRDIKRYLNNLNFYLHVVKSEVNIEDYLLISALQVFENQIYLDIRSNKKLFADDFYLEINHDNEKTKKDIDEIIKRRKKVNENTIKRILCKLFPKINYVYNNILDPDYSSWESNLKIASPKFFNKYFTLNIPENEISTTELNYIIDSNDYKSLENNILEIEQPEKIIDLLEKLSNKCLDIPQKKIPLFIEFLFKKGDIIRPPYNGIGYYDLLISDLLSELVLRTENSFNIIKENTLKKGTSLFIPIWFLDDRGKDYLNDEQLKQMEKIILDKIHDCNKRGKLLSCYHLNVILKYWSSIENKEVVKEFIKGVFKDENKTIKLINGFITEVEHVKLNIEDVFGNNSKLSPNYTERWSSITFDLRTMKTLISLEYVIEQLNKKQYSTEHKELIEELKRQIEDDLKM